MAFLNSVITLYRKCPFTKLRNLSPPPIIFVKFPSSVFLVFWRRWLFCFVFFCRFFFLFFCGGYLFNVHLSLHSCCLLKNVYRYIKLVELFVRKSCLSFSLSFSLSLSIYLSLSLSLSLYLSLSKSERNMFIYHCFSFQSITLWPSLSLDDES